MRVYVRLPLVFQREAGIFVKRLSPLVRGLACSASLVESVLCKRLSSLCKEHFVGHQLPAITNWNCVLLSGRAFMILRASIVWVQRSIRGPSQARYALLLDTSEVNEPRLGCKARPTRRSTGKTTGDVGLQAVVGDVQ